MKPLSQSTAFIILILTLTACQAQLASPTATPVPSATDTPLPTMTSTPQPTFTPLPTETKPAGSADLPTLRGTPLANWQGIPIMPDAIAGEGDAQSYTFTIGLSAADVQAYYQREMPKLGWQAVAQGQGSTKAVLLIFTQGTEIVTISALPQSDGTVLVLIIK